MTYLETIAAIRVLMTELIGRVKDTKTAELVQKIQGHQHTLEKDYQKEILDASDRHAAAIKEATARHADAIASKEAELAAIKVENMTLKEQAIRRVAPDMRVQDPHGTFTPRELPDMMKH